MRGLKILVIVSLCLCSCLFLFACNNSRSSIELNTEQQQAYDEVVAYASGCSNASAELEDIKIDISKVEDDEKLDNEVKIGKLRIDKLKLLDIMNSDIRIAENQSSVNKRNYKDKMNSITNKYNGTYSQYRSDVSYYENKISQAYASYMADVRQINNSNMGSGYKQQYQNQRYSQYLNEIRPYENQISLLNTKWNNTVEYNKYKDLYNKEDDELQKKINTIESNFERDCRNIDNQISSLIANR